ncbi:gas vesicle protein GvpQ [Oceanobacillus saliphilus]|uniref:gas vesicle protein GvpQ n=1 Tax=Oceanobacillus saliphilus TaxID=2925834 RepID=UPI00201E4E71|nr:gas vesicle protein GvpQ [Oceanobacillus saliphilus]
MEVPKKIPDNPGVRASVLAGGISFLATTAPLLLPKVRKGLSHAIPRVKNILKRADDPSEIKEAAASEVKEEMAEQFRDKLTEGIQSKANEAAQKLQNQKDENAAKVHSNAEKVEEKMQNVLRSVHDKVAGAKEIGEEFQNKMKKRTGSDTGVRGVNHIKRASHIKGAASIKSSTRIKGPGSIKHHSDLRKA